MKRRNPSANKPSQTPPPEQQQQQQQEEVQVQVQIQMPQIPIPIAAAAKVEPPPELDLKSPNKRQQPSRLIKQTQTPQQIIQKPAVPKIEIPVVSHNLGEKEVKELEKILAETNEQTASDSTDSTPAAMKMKIETTTNSNLQAPKPSNAALNNNNTKNNAAASKQNAANNNAKSLPQKQTRASVKANTSNAATSSISSPAPSPSLSTPPTATSSPSIPALNIPTHLNLNTPNIFSPNSIGIQSHSPNPNLVMTPSPSVPSSLHQKNKRKRYFAGDLRHMMYGYGDVPNPANDAIELMDDLVVDYIVDITKKASKIAQRRGKMKPGTEDIVFSVRKDPKKLARIEELLRMNEELKKARKAFDVDEMEDDKS